MHIIISVELIYFDIRNADGWVCVYGGFPHTGGCARQAMLNCLALSVIFGR